MPVMWLHRRSDSIGLAVGAILTLIIVIEMFIYVLQADQGPLEPVSLPTAVPTPVASPQPVQATPTVQTLGSTPTPGSLPYMLAYAPDRLRDDSLPLGEIATYADIERWMQVRKIATPTGSDDPSWDEWHSELATLMLPEILTTRALDDVWTETYGFDLTNLKQVLAVGSAPDYVIVMRGDFDRDALLAAWTENGYQAMSVGAITYWSLYPADSVDLSAPASRPALGNMNNLVILDDGTLIATTRSGRMERTIRALEMPENTLAQNAEIRDVLAPLTHPENLVTAILLKGSILELPEPQHGPITFATPTAALPRGSLVLVGIRLPMDDEMEADMTMIIRYASADDARMVSHTARVTLLQGESGVTDRPFTDRFALESMRVTPTGSKANVLVIQLQLQWGLADWIAIVEQRDFEFVMTRPDR